MKEKTLVNRQIYGAICIVLIVVFIYAARNVFQYVRFFAGPAVCGEYIPSGIMVKFAGDKNYGGIYYLPQEALVSDLVRKAGIDDIAGFKESDLARMLHSGDKVVCGTARYRVTIEDIAAPVRLALGMPIDLNKATRDELKLIPGIGTKTASKIIKVRKDEGEFSTVEALKLAGCMREKRYDRVKEYLYIKPSSP